MIRVVGIQFDDNKRIYNFNSLNIDFKVGEKAIVDTARGMEIGTVAVATKSVEESSIEFELKDVIRKATPRDEKYAKENKENAEKAFEIFKNEVRKTDLEMKPLYAEYTIDRTKIIFYYAADDRIDFRDLIKALTPHFKARIELHQIGPREGARIIGGLGSCGREVCCKSCLTSFVNVTMKMAKEQGMSLNSNKISGSCGKLMCCIAFENELYKELKLEVPGVGTIVKTPNCDSCKIIAVDYIKKVVRCQEQPDAGAVSYSVNDITVLKLKEPKPEIKEEIAVNEDLQIKEMKEEQVDKPAKPMNKYEKRMANQRKRNKK